MARPVVLLYNLEKAEKLKLMFICGQMKILCLSVPREDYGQSIAALAGLRRRAPEPYQGEGFSDEMLVMANFSSALFQSFMNALKLGRAAPIPLKALMTPTNAEWDSVRLHDEILREHREMHRKK